MTNVEKSRILIIDDEPDEVGRRIDVELDNLGLVNRVTASVIHPQAVELSDLESADLVLVDYKLENWSERDTQLVSLKPETGMALAVLLREQVDRSENDRLTAFALHTAHLNEIQGRLPSTTAQHVLAHLNNLEWVFAKADSRRLDQMVLLTEAVRQLPKDWPSDSNKAASEVRRLLGLDDNMKSFERCWARCTGLQGADTRIDCRQTRNSVHSMASPSSLAVSLFSVGGTLGCGTAANFH